MTTSNAAIYEEQYEEVSIEQQELCDAYQASLDKLDTEDSSQGMITIMTSTLILVDMWQEAMMMDDVVTLNALSTMQADESGMQADFDQYDEEYQENWDDNYDYEYTIQKSNGLSDEDAKSVSSQYADSVTTVSDPDLITDAYGYAQDMQEIANLPEFASISDDVTNQIDTIFDVNSDGSLNLSGTENMWNDAVSASDQADSLETDTDANAAADILQDMTNAFSALSTDFSGVSSSTQSEMQYYESEDQQMQGLDETLMKSWAVELQSMINNQAVS